MVKYMEKVGEENNKKNKESRAQKYIIRMEKKMGYIKNTTHDYFPYFSPNELILTNKELEKKKIIMGKYLLKYLSQKHPSFNGVKLLIENDAPANVNNSEALLLACMSCSLRTVKYFLQKKARINNIGSLIIAASKYGKLHTVKYLYSMAEEYMTPSQLKDMISSENNDAVIWAANHGSIKMVKWLISHGADITAQHQFALKLCVCSRKIDMVRYILSLTVMDLKKENYITFALEWEDVDMVDLLVNHGARVTKYDKTKYEYITGKKLELTPIEKMGKIDIKDPFDRMFRVMKNIRV